MILSASPRGRMSNKGISKIEANKEPKLKLTKNFMVLVAVKLLN